MRKTVLKLQYAAHGDIKGGVLEPASENGVESVCV